MDRLPTRDELSNEPPSSRDPDRQSADTPNMAACRSRSFSPPSRVTPPRTEKVIGAASRHSARTALMSVPPEATACSSTGECRGESEAHRPEFSQGSTSARVLGRLDLEGGNGTALIRPRRDRSALRVQPPAAGHRLHRRDAAPSSRRVREARAFQDGAPFVFEALELHARERSQRQMRYPSSH